MKQIYYRELHGYKYELCCDFYINIGIKGYDVSTPWLELSPSGLLRIKKGYKWDGASGPTIDSKSTMRGSLVHDAIYQLIRLGKLEEQHRKHADELLKRLMIEDGTCRFRANYWEKAVRLFAHSACHPDHEKPDVILVAPED